MGKKVSSDEFYKKIGPLDVVLEVQGSYPYKTLYKLRNSGKVIGFHYGGII